MKHFSQLALGTDMRCVIDISFLNKLLDPKILAQKPELIGLQKLMKQGASTFLMPNEVQDKKVSGRQTFIGPQIPAETKPAALQKNLRIIDTPFAAAQWAVSGMSWSQVDYPKAVTPSLTHKIMRPALCGACLVGAIVGATARVLTYGATLVAASMFMAGGCALAGPCVLLGLFLNSLDFIFPRLKTLMLAQPPHSEKVSSFTPYQGMNGHRARIPQKRAVIKEVGLKEAVAQCDEIIFGQKEVKPQLAIAFGSNAYFSERFYYLLEGPAGVGKSALATRLGQIYGRPVVTIRCDTLHIAQELTGWSRGWQHPGIGKIAEGIIRSGVSNPIIFLDEIDKISADHDRKTGIYSVLNALLSRENMSFRDDFLERDIDTSGISFLCAANNAHAFDRMPWLKSRIGRRLTFKGYNKEDLITILSDYLLPRTAEKARTNKAPFEMQGAMQLTPAACTLLIDRYVAAHGTECGVRELKDWVDMLHAGLIMIEKKLMPIDRPWLEKHWELLLGPKPPARGLAALMPSWA